MVGIPDERNHIHFVRRRADPLVGTVNDDFPYYRGRPVELGAAQWWLVMGAVAVAFFALIYTQPVFRTGLAALIPAILFVGIMLGALTAVAGSAWRALFRRLRAADFLWILVFFILNWVVTFIVGFIVIQLFAAEANPAGGRQLRRPASTELFSS